MSDSQSRNTFQPRRWRSWSSNLMLVRLFQHTTKYWGERSSKIPRAPYAPVGRRAAPSSKSEQGLESGHGLHSTVVSKDIFIQVDLKLSAADPVVGANQPLLQVADGPVGQWHHRFRTLAQIGSERLLARDMIESTFFQGKALESVGVNRRTLGHVLLDEGTQRSRFEVGDHRHSNAARRPFALLDCHDDECRSASLELSAPSKPRLSTAYPSVVNLHLAMQPLARRIDHRASELVKHHPRRFVSSQPKLALQKQGRHAAFVGGHQVGCPKPGRQRDLRVVKNSPGRQGDLESAGGALPTSSFHDGIGPPMPASPAREAIGPATSSQIVLAGLFAGKLKLKLPQGRRKARARHPSTLHLAAC
jgi:hypothetical protein